MSEATTEFFIEDMLNRIEYHRKENEITYIEALGCCRIIQNRIYEEMLKEDEDEL